MSVGRMALVGLAQAVATAAHCAIIVSFLENISRVPMGSIYLRALAILLLFVASACVAGGLVLGYPGYLIAKQRFREGITTLVFTVGWLTVLFIIVVVVGVVTANRTP